MTKRQLRMTGRAFLPRLGRDRRGATAIEFALIGLPFVLLLIQIVELSMVFLTSTTLDNAVTIASRTIQTGQARHAGAPATAQTFAAAVCANMGWMEETCVGSVHVDVRTEMQFGNASEPDPMSSGTFNPRALTFNVGGPGQIILVRAFLKTPLIMPVIDSALSRMNDGSAVIVSTTTFANEIYS